MALKLSRIISPNGAGCWSLAALTVCFSGCASTPTQGTLERLDPDTAVTVTVIPKPVEMVAGSLHNAGGDPFAFLAPFETDRAGVRAQYLWIAAPGAEAPSRPELQCAALPPMQPEPISDLAAMGLSRPPYEKPAPWSEVWYIKLPPEWLACLSSAPSVGLQIRAESGDADTYTVDSKGLEPFRAFGAR